LRVLRARQILIVTSLVVTAAASASAHPVPFTYLDLRVDRDAVDGTLVAHIFDIAHDLNLDPNLVPPERLLEPVTPERAAAVVALLAPRVTIAADGRVLAAAWSSVEAVPERQSLRLHVRYALTAPAGTLTVTTGFFPYDPNHQTFLNVYEGTALTQAILDAGRPRFEYYAGTTRGALAVMRTFVPAGIRHILTGPDHIVFLVGLLLLGGTLGHLALVATAFTVAHAITLSLAALNIVTPPARLVEPAIALSLVYLGADNLLVSGPGGGRDVRAWIAFAFGFIHGFGFASVLGQAELPTRALAWALLFFNAGLEIGQLAVVVALALAISALRSRSEAAGRQLAFAGSVVVIVAGTFWFVQRVFFPGGIS
jgi:hypothetical protein